MIRQPFQVLVLPFRTQATSTKYAVFRRADNGVWQGVAGGGEDTESPADAAWRETAEESGLTGTLYQLDCADHVPACLFAARRQWPADLFVVPQHFFALDTGTAEVMLSDEHTEVKWLPFQQAYDLLRFDSNKTALWELDQRIRTGLLGNDREVRP